MTRRKERYGDDEGDIEVGGSGRRAGKRRRDGGNDDRGSDRRMDGPTD
jgi:hypothetical protein